MIAFNPCEHPSAIEQGYSHNLLHGAFWLSYQQLLECSYGANCPQEDIKRGEGVVFDSGAPEDEEEGGTIYNMSPSKGLLGCQELSFGAGQLNLLRIKVPHL